MSEKKEITVVEHIEADPKNENYGFYRLSNGVFVNFSNYHPFKTDKEAKQFVDLIINAQKMRDMMEKVLIHVDWSYENWTSNHGEIIKSEIKELLTN